MKHHAIEHTPIYDLDAHRQRQRQHKKSKTRQNALDLLLFFSIMLVCIHVFIF